MSLETKMEKLTARNYSTWRIIIESLLKSKGLYKYVAEEIDPDTDEKSMMKNEEAKHIMYSLMDTQQIISTGVCESAHALWEKIKANQEGEESDLRNTAYSEFLSFSYRKNERTLADLNSQSEGLSH